MNSEPKTEDLARLAAEAAGLTKCPCGSGCCHAFVMSDNVRVHNWAPHQSHDHAQILIDDAFAKGFAERMAVIMCESHNGEPFYKVFLQASAEDKTRAYLKAKKESGK